MPFFSPKTWKQRIVEFPGRRRLDDTSSADVYDVSRAEGTVTQEGDGFTAANMNDLEQRINNAVNDVACLSADEYDPNATYSSGDLRIHDNILHKANQDISVAEPWTPAHWDATTIAAELKAQAEDISDLNSSTPFVVSVTQEGTSGTIAVSSARVRNGVAYIDVEILAGAKGVNRLSIPSGFRPITSTAGIFAAATISSDMGKGVSITAEGSTLTIWLQSEIAGKCLAHVSYLIS